MTASSDGLAATKLRPPALPSRLATRSRLHGVLDAGVDGAARLLLVSAPAGSGKSTLLASWLAGRGGTVAWLQAEASDCDPARFWSYLVQAVSAADSRPASGLLAVVAGSTGDELVVVNALVNELALRSEPLVLVVDDYHLIDAAEVHRGMERLVELSPPQFTLVLATRMDPPFRLGRLRVRQQLVEVRNADLRFAAEEAPLLLGAAGARLDDAGVEALRLRTEGWAAGLVLAGMSLARASSPAEFLDAFAGDDSLIVEYLRDEFLAGLPPAERLRMLQVSVLEQFDGALVDAVTGGSDGADWLRRTAATNQLLIGLDRTGSWFRYHHLLRDLLRLEAEQSLRDTLPALHAQAAACFTSRGDHGRAIEHHLAAGDLSAAGQLMIWHGPKLLRDGQVATLRTLLERLGDLTGQLAWCALLYGWCESMAGRYDSALAWIETTLAVASDRFDTVITTSLRIIVSIGRGDVASALADAVSVDQPGVLESHNCDLATAVGIAYTWAGRPVDARRILHFTAAKAADEDFPTARALALTYLAVVELDDGTRAAARSAAEAALAVAVQLGLGEYPGIAPAYAVRARTGDDEAMAFADGRRAVELGRRAPSHLGRAYVLTAAADMLLEHAQPNGAHLLAEAKQVLDHCLDPGIVGRHLARVTSRHGLGEPVDRPTSTDLVEQLTERELAVLRYLPSPRTQREIAVEMFVSLNTVKTHCRATYRKLGVTDRKAAVQAARELRLI